MAKVRRHVKTLYLLRHVKSSWEGDDIPDHDRPLAPRGERAARRLGLHLKGSDVRPELVLCSSARRAQETLTAITRALKSGTESLIEEDLYGASASELLARLRKVAASTSSVMVVGHNPGLQDLALVLTGDGDEKAVDQLRTKFPTGALATLDLAGDWRKLGPGCAYLESVVVPRELG